MLKPSFLAALILLCLIIPARLVRAQAIDDLDINADKLSYSEDGSSLEATGSVEVTSGGKKVTSDHLVFIVADKRVIADNGFKMEMENGLRLSGGHIDYSFKTKSGITRDVLILYRFAVLTGDVARIDEDEVQFEGATFNTCGLNPPHYHVYSYRTTLYPKDGWVYGYLGYFWVDGIPVVPVPIYLYDVTGYRTGTGGHASTSTLAVPEFGSNDVDGSYVIYKVPWIWNRKLSGSAVFFNTDRGGFGGGVEGNYIINDFNDTNLRLYSDKRYNTYGGVTHTFRFGPKIGEGQSQLYSFFNIRQQLMFDLVTNYSYKERLNFQRVSMTPNVTVKMNDVPAFFDNFKIGGSVSYGHISEETSPADLDLGGISSEPSARGYDTGNLSTNGYFDVPTDYGQVQVGMGYKQSWYGEKNFWTRMYNEFKLSRGDDLGFDSFYRHKHYVYYDGISPFLYEQYLNAPSDEFEFGLGYNFGPHRFSIDYSYYVPSWDTRELKYDLSLAMHCIALDLIYNSANKQFSVGVGLIVR